ncbi:MAG: UDP-glucose 4-epimerase GalE [Bacteroidales bacterium]|nr:UDP-glucose 4-epimerase GalE [Bacteroidales bacterium]
MDGKKRVLVSGGAGYIGSHTAVELLNAGYDVVVIDNLSNSERESVAGVESITGKKVAFEMVDTCDIAELKAVFEKYQFDSVIHFAAYKAVGESMAEPLKYYQNNLVSFMNILSMMKEYGRPNILFSSSATVYGDAEHLPVTESTPRQPATSPYGNTKQIAEDILRDCCRAYENIRGIALRYFNPIGAHPSSLIGELPRGVPNNLVPFITQTAAGIRKCLSVFGNDYDTPDGTCLRDYIDVVDLAKAHVAAVDRMTSDTMEERYEIFNIGTGRPVSVLELLNTFEKVNDLKLPYRMTDRRPGDVPAVWAETSRANEVLGWRAENSLEQTLRSAWEWEKRIRNIK